MRKSGLLLLAGLVAGASLACTLSIPMPPAQIKLGPTEERSIVIDPVGAPGDTARLELGMGAGELILRPGDAGALLAGTATFNIADFEPQVEVDGTQVVIDQGDLQLEGLPDLRGDDLINRWDFALGGQPIDLKINAGAYKADIELGGVSLTGLQISDGAAAVRLRFSEPNPASIDALSYVTGASDVRLEGLANANFSQMSFEGGAGSFTLDFGGTLRQDAVVHIQSGLSSLRIVVPEGVPARADVEGELSEVKTSGAWSGSGPRYVHPGEGPGLTLTINSSLGSVQLETD